MPSEEPSGRLSDSLVRVESAIDRLIEKLEETQRKRDAVAATTNENERALIAVEHAIETHTAQIARIYAWREGLSARMLGAAGVIATLLALLIQGIAWVATH